MAQPCSQQMLAGITTAGWIAISVCIGMFLGSVSTLAFQCYRARRRQRQHASTQLHAGGLHTGPTRQVLHAHATPAATAGGAPVLPAGIEYRPPPALAPPHTPSVVKYFSPLSAKHGGGAVLSAGGGAALQMQQLTSSHVRISVDAGDIHALQACDQQLQRDPSYAGMARSYPSLASMPQGPLSSQAPLSISTTTLGHGLVALQHPRQHPQLHPAGCNLSVEQLRMSQAPVGQQQQQLSHGSYATQTQRQSIRMQGVAIMPGEMPFQEDSDVLPVSGGSGAAAKQVWGAAGIAADDSASSFGSCTAHTADAQPPAVAAAAAAAAAAAQSPQGSASSAVPAASKHLELDAPCPVELGTAASGSAATTPAVGAVEYELEEEYDVEDLDADWRQLLADLDARLAAQGARLINPRERSIAIKKLLVATGTRGVDFAMNDALEEVLRFRAMHD